MSLQIVSGSSGAGKSYTIYQEVINASMAHPERTYLVIVPEQFTMQTQKDLVRMHPRHGLLNVDVLSFNRLAWRVFEEVGGNREPILDDLGKSLVLQRIISASRKEIRVLGGTLGRQGSVEQMKSLISELMQYRVRPEDLETWADDLPVHSELLSRKLQDVQCVYRGFMEYLDCRYLTTEEVPERLANVIGASSFVKDAVVVMDGFTGFTPVQHSVVRELLKLCSAVTVIVTADARADLMRPSGPQRLFHMSAVMVRKLYDLAREAGCEILPVRQIDGRRCGRFCQNRPMDFLEHNLFRYRHSTFPAEQDRVNLLHAADPRAELGYITAEICRRVRMQGMRYRDFAIVTGDLEQYGREAARQLGGAGIPYFLDQKQSVLANPLAEYLRAAVDMVVRGFSYESVFRFLRSGLTSFTPNEIDRMDLYCLGTGVRGWKQYKSRWIRLTRRMQPEEIEPLNELRIRFVEQLEAFTEGMRVRGASLRQRVETLYRLMAAQNLQQKLADLAQQYEAAGDRIHAREYAQIYPLVIDMLDRMVEILGDEKTSMSGFQELLEAGLAELRIGQIPPGEDQVMVGDIERTRLKHVRVLFFVGINEGIVPRASGGDGILSETDRDLLAQQSVELAPDSRTQMYQQRFYLYLAMTKPRDALYLSYSDMSLDGSTRMPSYLIGVILDLFPAMPILHADQQTLLHRLETPEGTLETLLEELRGRDRTAKAAPAACGKEVDSAKASPAADGKEVDSAKASPAADGKEVDSAKASPATCGKELDTAEAAPVLEKLICSLTEMPQLLMNNEPGGKERISGAMENESEGEAYDSDVMEKDQQGTGPGEMQTLLLRILDAAEMYCPEGGLRKETANALYGSVLVNSATRLERYASCAFAHFAQYGLHLNEREEYTFTPADMGTIMHRALELFERKRQKQHLVWNALSEAQRNSLVDASLDEIVHDYGNTILHSSSRYNQMISRIRRILYRTVWALQQQLLRSAFVPAGIEAGFRSEELSAMNIHLSDQERMRLQGRIDRIDLCEEDGVRYVRVIDYKTGQTTFDPGALYYGLQLQLPLYMNAALELTRKMYPKQEADAAGIYYYQIKDPIIELEDAEKSGDPAVQEKAFLKALRMDGLSRSEDHILALLDRTTQTGGQAEVIPVSRNKSGSLGAASRVADAEQFETIRQYTTQKIRSIGQEILAGETRAYPYADGAGRACDWCPYRPVCGFDTRIPGYRYRRIRKMKRDEAIAEMEKVLEEK